MAGITMRKIQENRLFETITLYLASAAGRRVKDKTLRIYEQHFNEVSKRLDVDGNQAMRTVEFHLRSDTSVIFTHGRLECNKR